ncbi:hypothetical protein HK101_010369, partial [Irineochytrium annulatum]
MAHPHPQPDSDPYAGLHYPHSPGCSSWGETGPSWNHESGSSGETAVDDSAAEYAGNLITAGNGCVGHGIYVPNDLPVQPMLAHPPIAGNVWYAADQHYIDNSGLDSADALLQSMIASPCVGPVGGMPDFSLSHLDSSEAVSNLSEMRHQDASELLTMFDSNHHEASACGRVDFGDGQNSAASVHAWSGQSVTQDSTAAIYAEWAGQPRPRDIAMAAPVYAEDFGPAEHFGHFIPITQATRRYSMPIYAASDIFYPITEATRRPSHAATEISYQSSSSSDDGKPVASSSAPTKKAPQLKKVVKNGSVRYQCQWKGCTSDFSSRHMRIHQNVKPFLCKLCDAKFTRSD